MSNLQFQHTPLVLVADDDRSTRIILRLLLLREGYEVVEVDNGQKCLETFSERKPDMVLLDAQMPLIDGFECCERLRELPQGDRVPVLMITGLEDSESVNRAFQSGAADFITKPINALILSRRLRYLLATSQAELALRESEERYRSVVDNLKEIIFQTDVEGKLTFLNPAWESVTGFSLKSFIGKKFFSFLCPESSQPLSIYLKKILDGEISEYRDEIRFINQHGGFGWLELYATSFVSQEGEVMGISGSLNDITERKDREFLDQLERSTIKVLAEAETLETAIPSLLDVIGQHLEWDYSEFWIQNKNSKGQSLKCIQKWYTSIEEHRDYYVDYPPFNTDYIYQCWGIHENSINQQKNIEICELYSQLSGSKSDIQSAFSFSISDGYDCLGIIVFLKEFHSKIDETLLNRLKSIGSQIGAFMMRKIAEEKLKKHHDLMRSELDQAAHYIRALLPKAFSGDTQIDYYFMPSNDLGGDIFDYEWLDSDHLAIYLVDVAGHGIQSALLSISVLNVLRSKSLQKTDFYQPASVLENLNQVFQMGEQGDDYFTIWYGVYHRLDGTITYSSAGHPPALVIQPDNTVVRLDVGGIAVGLFPFLSYQQEVFKIPPGSKIYIFSDGVYEIIQSDGMFWSFDAFEELLVNSSNRENHSLQSVFEQICDVTESEFLEDDFSLIQVSTPLHFPSG